MCLKIESYFRHLYVLKEVYHYSSIRISFRYKLNGKNLNILFSKCTEKSRGCFIRSMLQVNDKKALCILTLKLRFELFFRASVSLEWIEQSENMILDAIMRVKTDHILFLLHKVVIFHITKLSPRSLSKMLFRNQSAYF